MKKTINAGGNSPVRQFIFMFFALTSVVTVWAPYMVNAAAAVICWLCGIAAGALCTFVRAKNDKIPIRQIAAGVIIVLCAALFNRFFNGFVHMANGVIAMFNSAFNAKYMFIDSSGVTLFDNVVFGVIAACSFALITEVFTSKAMYGAVTLFVFVNVEFNLLMGVSYSYFWIIVLITAFGICWALGSRCSGSGVGNAAFVGAATAVCTAVFLGIWGGFAGSADVAVLKDAVSQTVSDVRYGSDDLPEGNMTKAAQMHKGDAVRLRIEADRPLNNNIYLYGYVGAEYNGFYGWEKAIKQTDDEWNGIFNWLSEKSFVPQLRYADSTEQDAAVAVRIANESAKRLYLYVPFTLKSIDGSFKFDDDSSVVSKGLFGTTNYSFSFYDSAVSDDELLGYGIADSAGDENAADSVYNAYADSVYTKIDDVTKGYIDKMFFNSQNFDKNSGLYSTISRIRTILELSAAQSKGADAFVGKENFVGWFMKSRRYANSPYYATIATLALRAAGYPARYAEGYYVTANGNSVLYATSDDGHAWAEVYLANKGWVPIEFTPGFYRQSLFNKMTVEISSKNISGGSSNDNEYMLAEEFGGSGGDGADEVPGGGFTMRQDIMIKLTVAALLGLIVLIVFALRCVFIKKRRKKNFASEAPERYIYSDIVKLINLGGVKCDDSKPLECAVQVETAFGNVRKEEYERIISIMQKSIFGQKKLEKREIHSLISFYAKIRKELYKNSGGLKKIKMWVIDVA